MIKTKIYAAAAARVIILFVLFVGLVPFFVIYIISLIGETYLNMVGSYVAQTKILLIEWDKKLK